MNICYPSNNFYKKIDRETIRRQSKMYMYYYIELLTCILSIMRLHVG